MRRTWMVLPVMLALLLAWPLMVNAMRAQSSARSVPAPVGGGGGSATPAAVAPSAPATSAAVTPATAPSRLRVAVSRSAVPTRTAKPVMTMSMSALPRTTTAAPAARTTVARSAVARTTVAATTVPPTHASVPTTSPSTRPTTKPVSSATTKAARPSGRPTHTSSPIPTPSHEPSTGGTVTMGNFQYAMPESVAPGARIAIFNADTVGHTLTIASAGIDVVVEGGRYGYLTAPGTPGSYQVTCDYHADMVATLVVR
ncbi:MAG: hypothetical protein QOE76_2564 [Frankiales bacterium]|jgi:plastocyanin|nr:hypothetical protein [Frankiales bacterium]